MIGQRLTYARAMRLARQRGLPPLQEAAHGAVVLQSNRHVVALPRLLISSGLAEQLGARRPVGLVFGHAAVGGQHLDLGVAATGPRVSATATQRLRRRTGEVQIASRAS